MDLLSLPSRSLGHYRLGGHETTLGCAVKAAGRNAEMLRSIQVLLKPGHTLPEMSASGHETLLQARK
jgi:hypothetical protein